MVFSSLVFLYGFLPLCLLAYFLARSLRAKNIVLVIASLFFYAWGEPVWVCLLIFSAMVDFIHGKLIHKYRGRWQAKAALCSSLIINFSLLGVFKYLGFFMETLNLIPGVSVTPINFALPIGISFYTFQTVSYTIDVYRGKAKVQKSFLSFLLFVSLFPQLVAGPILRYTDLAEQLDKRKHTLDKVGQGVTRFLIGLGKKVLIANTAGAIVATLLEGNLTDLSVSSAWFGMLMFAFQIYFDFSGYSDMAIGMGKMFGFEYAENFNYPYIARSVTDFWRRWHISLGQFFRDYVYIPMGGNRSHALRNILVVWFLTGMWHGASWNFIFWGLYFGLLLLVEKYMLRSFWERMPKLPAQFLTFFLVVIGWVFFYFVDTDRLWQMFGILFGLSGQPLVDAQIGTIVMNNIFFVFAAGLASLPIAKLMRGLCGKLFVGRTIHVLPLLQTVYNVLLLGASTILLVSSSYNPFLYFRF